MQPHLHLLWVLQIVWGAIGVLLGVSTLMLAAGAGAIGWTTSGDELAAGIMAGAFAICAVLLLAAGFANGWAGTALRRRQPNGRMAALALAVPNLFVLPFGTALGIYAFWVLLHAEARAVRASRMTTSNTERTSSGLDANVAAALTYVIGWVTGALFFLLEPENKFVRFHALQSILVFGGLSLAWMIAISIPYLGWIVAFLVIPPLSAVLWLILMYKAYQGERFKVPGVGQMVEDRVG